MPKTNISTKKMVGAILVGLAGGVTVGAALPLGIAGIVTGSIAGGIATGLSEYNKESKKFDVTTSVHKKEMADML